MLRRSKTLDMGSIRYDNLAHMQQRFLAIIKAVLDEPLAGGMLL